MTRSADLTAGCRLCPRECLNIPSEEQPGRCHVPRAAGFFRVARLMVHPWEEPYISGSKGSGTVFFSGCSLGCLFCQNEAISHRAQGETMRSDQLLQAMEDLAARQVHNLNLVTASHYGDHLSRLLPVLKQRLKKRGRLIPVVWNSSAYEKTDMLAALADSESVDVFLPDLKFFDPELSGRLAAAPDYFARASQAILAMHRLRPDHQFSDDGLLLRGLALRHLVLPGAWRDSLTLIDFIAANLPPDTPVALMRQYTPPTNARLREQIGAIMPRLLHKVTSYEYDKVCEHAEKRGLKRLLFQEPASADSRFTPDFTG